MTDRLSIYNLTLGHLRERRLSSLSENREPLRVLNDTWDQAVAECVAEGLWKHMMRAIQVDASTTVVPAFGWKYAFTIPNDWVRTDIISSVETMNPPLSDYIEEAGYWYANWTPIFVRYISNDPLYGMNLGAWPANFTGYVALHLAEYTCARITGSTSLMDGPDGIVKRTYKAKVKAKSTDAMNDPPGMMPTGTWTRARRGFLRGVPLPGGTGYDD